MILNLNSESDITPQNLKKLEELVSEKNTVLFNYATWCGHCHVFRPQWEKFKTEMGTKVNYVEIESAALNKISAKKTLYKKITPTDGAVYFPMIILFVKKNDKACEKKLYDGNRDASSLKTFVTSKIKTTKSGGKTVKKNIGSKKTALQVKQDEEIHKPYVSLFSLNKELDDVIRNLRNNNF